MTSRTGSGRARKIIEPKHGVAGNWNAVNSRAMELLSNRYPGTSLPELVNYVKQSGGFPVDIQRAVQAEERATFVNSGDPVSAIRRAAELRGYVSPQMQEAQRQAAADQRRRAEAQRRAQEAKAEAKEQEWRNRIARRIALPGETIENVLPRREDRVRFYRGARYFQQPQGGW